MNTDINGAEFILDVDGDTSITADTDDQIDFKAGGTDTLHVTNGKVGVGIAAAARTFHVHDDTQPYIHMSNNTTGTATSDGFDILVDSSTGKAVLNNRENQSIEFMTNNSVVMNLDNNGKLGIGVASPEAQLHVLTGDASVGPNAKADEGVFESNGHSGISILSGSSSDGSIYFGDSGDDNVGQIAYAHGSDNLMQFITNGSEQVRIHSNGVLSASDGVALGVGLNNTASNVLDDYEEGTFTPTINFPTVSYFNQRGFYRKIGSLVYIDCMVQWHQGNNYTDADVFQINGLPFAVENAHYKGVPGAIYTSSVNWNNLDGITVTQIAIAVGNGGSHAHIAACANNSNQTAVKNQSNEDGVVSFTVCYRTS